MNFESALLGRMVDDGDLHTVIRSGITADFFYDLEYRELFSDIQDHYQQHGEVPSRDFLEELFPDLELEETRDGLLALCDQVRETRISNDLIRMLEQMSESVESDPKSALRIARDTVSSVTSLLGQEDDVDITKCGHEIQDEYLRVKRMKGTVGIPFPWPRLNDETLGMHGGDFIVIYGRPKRMKTWSMQCICHHLHAHYRKRVVFCSQEMPRKIVQKRAVALHCALDYQKLRLGTLSSRVEREFMDDLESWEESSPYLVTRLKGQGKDALMEFESKLSEHDAEVGFFDGVYLAGMDWKELVILTRGLKQLSLDMDIPIIATCQENREGQVAYSDSFLQDCDLLIRCKRDKEAEQNDEIILQLPAARESRLNAFAINAKPAYDFSSKYTLADDDEKNNPYEEE